MACIERGMSTATTMMSNQHRRFVTPVVGVVGPPSNKRKERDGFNVPKPSVKKPARPTIRGSASLAPKKPPEPDSSNQLLAGYLAHEFLTKGTLFGQQWDPARAEAVAVSAESRRMKSAASCSQREKGKAEPRVEKYERYVEVADLLKTDGAHLPGVVNPSQLARFLQM